MKDFPPHILRGLFQCHAVQHTDSLCIYTDDSKTDRGVGYAFECHNHTYQRHILTMASIYTAELLAIRDATDYAIHTIRTGSVYSQTPGAQSKPSHPPSQLIQ